MEIRCKNNVAKEVLDKTVVVLEEWKNGNVRARKSHKWRDSVINLGRKERLVITKRKDAYLFSEHNDYERFINRKKEKFG